MTCHFNRGLIRSYHNRVDGYCKQGWRILEKEATASFCYTTLEHPNGHKLKVAIRPSGGMIYETML